MSKYKVVKLFTDLQDNGYRYNVGDIYPRNGLKVDKKRIEALSTSKNRQRTPLIEEIAGTTTTTDKIVEDVEDIETETTADEVVGDTDAVEVDDVSNEHSSTTKSRRRNRK